MAPPHSGGENEWYGHFPRGGVSDYGVMDWSTLPSFSTSSFYAVIFACVMCPSFFQCTFFGLSVIVETFGPPFHFLLLEGLVWM